MFSREPSPQIGHWLKRIMLQIGLAFAFWLVVVIVAIAWLFAVGARQ